VALSHYPCTVVPYELHDWGKVPEVYNMNTELYFFAGQSISIVLLTFTQYYFCPNRFRF